VCPFPVPLDVKLPISFLLLAWRFLVVLRVFFSDPPSTLRSVEDFFSSLSRPLRVSFPHVRLFSHDGRLKSPFP